MISSRTDEDTGMSCFFRGCHRQPLYCVHNAIYVWLHVTDIYIQCKLQYTKVI